MDYNNIRKLSKLLVASYGIKIKPENRGKFTDYCGGKVTEDCIQRGKNSPDPAIRKRATFAANARIWKHLYGGSLLNSFATYSPMALGDVPEIEFPVAQQDYVPSISDYSDPMDAIEEAKEETATTKQLKDDLLAFLHLLRNPKLAKEQEVEEGETETAETEETSSTGELIGSYADPSKALYIKLRLMLELDLTEAQAEGFVVNFNWESGLNPHIVAKPTERGGKKFSGGDAGLCLWTGERAKRFKSRYGHSVQDGTLEELVDYAIWEILQMPNLMRAVRLAKDIRLASRAVLLGFEGTYDKPDISESSYYDIYRHSISEALTQRLRKAGIK